MPVLASCDPLIASFWDKTQLASRSRFFGQQQQPFPGFSRSWNWGGSAAPSCQKCHSSPGATLQWLPAVGQPRLLTGVLNWFFSNILANIIANLIYFYFELVGKVLSYRGTKMIHFLKALNLMIPGDLTPNFRSSWPAVHCALNSHWSQ